MNDDKLSISQKASLSGEVWQHPHDQSPFDTFCTLREDGPETKVQRLPDVTGRHELSQKVRFLSLSLQSYTYLSPLSHRRKPWQSQLLFVQQAGIPADPTIAG